jgi:hypothetical protein
VGKGLTCSVGFGYASAETGVGVPSTVGSCDEAGDIADIAVGLARLHPPKPIKNTAIKPIKMIERYRFCMSQPNIHKLPWNSCFPGSLIRKFCQLYY